MRILITAGPTREFIDPVRFISNSSTGFFGYELAKFTEGVECKASDDLSLPDCFLCFYDSVIAFDHAKKKAAVLGRGRNPESFGALAGAAERPRKPGRGKKNKSGRAGVASNFSRRGYIRAVKAIKDYIAAGDAYQVNLSQRFECRMRGSAYSLYADLRETNPSPFGGYFDFGSFQLASSSPERFLKISGNAVETRPIKGTRPRGKTPKDDAALGRELLKSAKDAAEHVMIVDLERNDLGRVCRFGSVRVTEDRALEKYAAVQHLVSTVRGTLKRGTRFTDCVRACFPGGSITGAPKIRSMEIIDELEPNARSVYTGSMGYADFGGGADMNIAIRTFICKGGRAYFSAGGGIVADSDPGSEYEETLDKARALVEAVNA